MIFTTIVYASVLFVLGARSLIEYATTGSRSMMRSGAGEKTMSSTLLATDFGITSSTSMPAVVADVFATTIVPASFAGPSPLRDHVRVTTRPLSNAAGANA